VVDPPNATVPPPLNPVPAVTVIELLLNAPFGIELKFVPVNVGADPLAIAWLIVQLPPPNVNVFVGEVGKWLAFDDDPENAKDHDYQNKRLNNIMKGYLENQEKANEFH
jgi:hypothetical protein